MSDNNDEIKKGAAEVQAQLDAGAEIRRLAKLSRLEYEQQRKAALEKLGVRASILDQLVDGERARLDPDGGKQGQGQPIEFPEPEPWPDKVDGAALLSEIATAIRGYVVMSDRERDISALWSVYSHMFNGFLISPRLAIRAPMRGCGKTTLLDVLEHLVHKPLRTSSVTASVTFRVIEAHQPTLLIDEAKHIGDKTDLLEVLNDGHRRGGRTLRNVPAGDGYEPRAFATFAPVAIALIGSLPPELHDRSVVIDMKRRLPGDQVKEIRAGRNEDLDALARKATRWAADNAVRATGMEPVMPSGIYNREADNWKPLLAVADAAGGEWPQRARDAASQSHAAADVDDASRLELLLADISDVFAKKGNAPVKTLLAEKADVEVASAILVNELVEVEGHPWAEMGKGGKPLTQNRLARMLKPLGIAPGQIGPENARQRGYKLMAFEEAFPRYLPPEGVHNRPSVQNAANTGTSDDSKVSSQDSGCTVEKCEKPNNDGLLDGWTVAKEGEGGSGTTKAPGGNGHSTPVPPDEPVCRRCGIPGNATFGQLIRAGQDGTAGHFHPRCWTEERTGGRGRTAPGDGLDIPEFLRRAPPNDPGLSRHRIEELADWYTDQATHRYNDDTHNTAELDDELRAILREEAAFPEHIEIEFERVMQLVFPG